MKFEFPNPVEPDRSPVAAPPPTLGFARQPRTRFGLKLSLNWTSCLLAFLVAPVAWADRQGAKPMPEGLTHESLTQLKIEFPEDMATARDAFKVDCKPARKGSESWANNNKIWTYNFEAPSETESANLPGGAQCSIDQTGELRSRGGKVWPAGSISYKVAIDGPKVVQVFPAFGFGHYSELREKDPVMMIYFDGDINKAEFFSRQSGSLHYASSNFSQEKMSLVEVPENQQAPLIEHFNHHAYYPIKAGDKNWVIATIKQNLVPGAKVDVLVENVVSGYSNLVSTQKYQKELSVRSEFRAELDCGKTAKNPTCLANAPVTVKFNDQVAWDDAKDSTITYHPFGSKTEFKTTLAELKEEPIDIYDTSRFSGVKKFFNKVRNSWEKSKVKAWLSGSRNGPMVDHITFPVAIEAETEATIKLSPKLKDLDGRRLAGDVKEISVVTGSLKEFIRTPGRLSLFEKNYPNVSLPVGVVNLNQKIIVRKTANPDDPSKAWIPVRDMSKVISLVRAYENVGGERRTAQYDSPLDQKEFGVSSIVQDYPLTGEKNRNEFLHFPFNAGPQGGVGGLYVMEISSDLQNQDATEETEGWYLNPKHVLAQVTDLAVQLKKGKTSTLAWVTRLSDGKPVAGASLEIYNCLGTQMKVLQTDDQGVAQFTNEKWAEDCKSGEKYEPYYSIFSKDQFYAVARLGDDFSFTHSSWPSTQGFVRPMRWEFNSGILEEGPLYHAVVGVNLVQPGQKVPVEIFAQLPSEKGLLNLNPDQLPKKARFTSSVDEHFFKEFDLEWHGPSATFTWQVPAEEAVKLGDYYLTIYSKDPAEGQVVSSGSVEVGQFSVPLMTGSVNLPAPMLVRPDSIVANTSVHQANGVGAKGLPITLSYYFEPTSVSFDKMEGFIFGNGDVKTKEAEEELKTPTLLPTLSRPSKIENLVLDNDGLLARDIAAEASEKGVRIADLLKEVKQPQTLVVKARFLDKKGLYQTLSQAKTIYNSQYYLGTKLVAGKPDKAKLQAVVVQADGKPSKDTSDLQLKLFQVQIKSILDDNLFGHVRHEIRENLYLDTGWKPNCGSNEGILSCALGKLPAGTYAFQATSKGGMPASHVEFKVDQNGRAYIYNDFYDFGDRDNKKLLTLTQDKESYMGGQKAIVSFAAPFQSCAALVTLERSEVLSYFVQPDACEKGRVEIPVDAALAPNVFASVFAVVGRTGSTQGPLGLEEMDLGRPTFRLGETNLKVEWQRFETQVKVATDKKSYTPGENVQVTVQVQPEQGELQNGKVTILAIEEKILELKKNDTYDLLNALMQMRGHSVATISPLELVRTAATPATADRSLKAGGPERKGGHEAGGGGEPGEAVRKNFDALGPFATNIPIVNGQATFSFPAGDSLTKFSVIAVVSSDNHKFGTGRMGYLTEKPVQSFSNFPQIGRTGDSFPLRVQVENNSGSPGTFKAVVTATLKDLSGHTVDTRTFEKSVELEKSKSTVLSLDQMNIPTDGVDRISYKLRVYDANGKVVDKMDPEDQRIFPAVPLATYESFLASLDKSEFSREFTKEKGALDGKGELRISLAKSLIGGAKAQLADRVKAYNFADFLALSKFQKALIIDSKDELAKAFETLAAQTDENGFIKFFPQAIRGNIWLTAIVLNALMAEPEALAKMPQALKEQVSKAVLLVLNKSLNPEEYGVKLPMNLLRAQLIMGQAAYALQNAELMNKAAGVLAEIEKELSLNPQAFGKPVEDWETSDLADLWLLQSYASPGKAMESPAYSLLTGIRLNEIGNTLATLRGKPSYYGDCYSDETIETAKLLSGVSLLKGDKGLARRLATGIANASHGKWYNMTTLSWVNGSLKKFADAFESTPVSGTVTVDVPETLAATQIDFAKSATGSLNSPWPGQVATMTVKHSGTGSPWMSVEARMAVPLERPVSDGLTVEKSIRNLDRDNGFKPGDVVEVTLKVKANGAFQHVVLFDPIPAGSNIMDQAYGFYSSGEKSFRGYRLYFSALDTNFEEVKYQYQLNNPGNMNLPPTEAEGLMMPAVNGRAPNPPMNVNL
ncbi:MAG: hypothetical protein C5B49_01345 [Bdellovibrio sp.]|nr:MAG: hypothetical protein C5B49_01345 [Bdellovibrio sp.]